MNTSNAKAPWLLPTAPAISVWELVHEKRKRAFLLVAAKWRFEDLMEKSAATYKHVRDVMINVDPHKADKLTPAEQEIVDKAKQRMQEAAQEAAQAHKLYNEHPRLAEHFNRIDWKSPTAVDDVLPLID
uniref:Uncharacterized protein n=1 Tax=Tetradesmus obliquus TaxID=3088 RepID=A0A383W547_TETOB